MTRAVPAALAAVTFLGCSARPHLAPAEPHATPAPAAVDFGDTPVLFPVRRNLLLSDASTVSLHAGAPRIEGAQAAAFAVAGDAIEISPASSHQYQLAFTPPTKGAFAATLAIDTDDPDHPTLLVPLSGTASIAAAIAVQPASLDFGRVGEGQSAVRKLVVQSGGDADLYLASFDVPADFALLGAHAPATLAAHTSAELAVVYSPPGGAQLGPAALTIHSSDPAHASLAVPLSASINRAPLAKLTGQVNGGQATSGELDTAVGATVQLDGSGSTDPDGDLPLSLRFTLVLKPQGSAAQLAAAAGGQARVTLDAPGSYSVLLDAIDSTGVPSLLPARLDLRALPPEELLVQLIWDKIAPDLDLHFLELSPAGVAVGDCYWADPDPTWFGGGADQNPHHGGDKLTGYGPEEVRWVQPQDGNYRLDVVYKQDHGATDPSTNATVRVFAFGQQIAELRHAFARQGEVWTAGIVHWPSASVQVAP